MFSLPEQKLISVPVLRWQLVGLPSIIYVSPAVNQQVDSGLSACETTCKLSLNLCNPALLKHGLGEIIRLFRRTIRQGESFAASI